MSDLNPTHLVDFVGDALSPKTFAIAAATMGTKFAIVTSPWYTFLDAFLPLAIASVAEFVCVQVPDTYMTQGPRARLRFLRRLGKTGRLFLLYSRGKRNTSTGKRAVWMVVFKTTDVAKLVVKRSRFAASLPCLFEKRA